MPQACQALSWVVELGPDSQHARVWAEEVMVGCAFISLSLICSQKRMCGSKDYAAVVGGAWSWWVMSDK
jgi:hypothetical protein